MRKLLIDGDVVAYRFASAAETKHEWDAGNITYDSNLPKAKAEARAFLNYLQERLAATSYVITLSDPSRRYFRHDILPSYKSHRTQGRVPEGLSEVKAFLRDEFESITMDTLEADDVMGILATKQGWASGHEKVIVTYDKDLLTIPGKHFNPKKDTVVHTVSTEWADYNHLYQTLIGDTCDGFKGCPGIGPVKAVKLLYPLINSPKEMWSAVVEVYAKKGLTEADALVQAQVARICRASDFNFETKRAIPWTPQSPP